jgi:ABC-2 type transport system permease protein
MLSPTERSTTGDGIPESAQAPPRANAPRWRATTPMRVVTPDVSVWSRLGGLWTHRELLIRLIRKELKVKYKDSVLGFLWSMLNPALYLLVFYFVFQIVLKNTIPTFAIFLLTGLLVWNLFSSAVPGATTAVVGNAGIVKKVAFPREMLALSSVGASLIFFFLQAIVLIIALIGFHLRPALHYLPLLIAALITLLVFSGALAVFLSAVNVYLRDTQHLLELVLVAWFWATPIVYPYRLIADRLAQHGLAWILLLNPITPVVLTFQRAIYARPQPIGTDGHVVHILPLAGPWWYLEVLGIVCAVSAVLFVGALHVFGRLEGNFAEEL